VLHGHGLVNIDLPTQCVFCGGRDGNHINFCAIVGNITGYNVLPHYVDEEDNAPEPEDTPCD